MWTALLDWELYITIIIAALVFLYHRIASVYTYFEKRNIPFIPGKFIFGSDVNSALLKRPVGLSFDDMYWKMKGEKMFGIFIALKPFLVVKDPDFVNKILTSDFEHFHDRGFMVDEIAHPLDGHLFFLNGNKWKLVRTLLTPIFTSGKLKFMFSEMNKCSEILMNHLSRMSIDSDVDLKDIFGRFTTDVIASSAFGLEPQSITNPENQFRKMGKQVFEITLWKSFIVFLHFAAPTLIYRFKLSPISREENFYLNLFKDVFDLRRNSGKTRKDFVQLLLELKKKKFLEGRETYEKDDINPTTEGFKDKIEITDEILAAQSFVFLLAGFETTSDCLNYTAFLLSKNKIVQEKARNEVRSVLQRFNGEYSYDALKEMTYLDHCITESTRLLPPVPQLNRVVTKDYTFPDGTTVEKGLSIVVPLYSIQRDPENFPEPHLYNPDRFYQHQTKGLYLPFGEGPRHCIGKRFAEVEMKLVLAKLLDNYNLEESKITKDPLEFQSTMQLTPSHPLFLKLVQINKN